MGNEADRNSIPAARQADDGLLLGVPWNTNRNSHSRGNRVSTDQEYWDACLIRGWRLGLPLIEAMKMFKSITGKRTDEAGILRVPKGYFAKETKVYVANRLPKISEWLFKCGPEHDAALLKKLSASKYDSLEEAQLIPDRSRTKLHRDRKQDIERMKFTSSQIGESRSATDWGTMKGTKIRAMPRSLR